MKEKLASDRPNKYLGELLQTIEKTKDAAKRAELQKDYEYKLANSKANTKKMIEAKEKRITEQEAAFQETVKAIADNAKDTKEASFKLSAFEDKYVGKDGKIKAEIEQGVC